MAQEYKIKGLSSLSLKPGDKQEVELEGLDSKVLLLNAAGKIQAIGPRCTHYGAPLVNGVLSTNGRLTCPWHGGEDPSALRGRYSGMFLASGPEILILLFHLPSMLQHHDGRR